MCVCVCVLCVRERGVCMYVCVCVRGGEREYALPIIDHGVLNIEIDHSTFFL